MQCHEIPRYVNEVPKWIASWSTTSCFRENMRKITYSPVNPNFRNSRVWGVQITLACMMLSMSLLFNLVSWWIIGIYINEVWRSFLYIYSECLQCYSSVTSGYSSSFNSDDATIESGCSSCTKILFEGGMLKVKSRRWVSLTYTILYSLFSTFSSPVRYDIRNYIAVPFFWSWLNWYVPHFNRKPRQLTSSWTGYDWIHIWTPLWVTFFFFFFFWHNAKKCVNRSAPLFRYKDSTFRTVS